MNLPQHFLIGVAAGLAISLLPRIIGLIAAGISAGGERSALWRPSHPRAVRRDAARATQPQPRHLADVRLGLLRRGC